MEIDHQQGLDKLRELLLPYSDQLRQEYFTLEARLLTNLGERRYGREDSNNAQYFRIIEALNIFLNEQLHLSSSFLDFCRPSAQALDPFGQLEIKGLSKYQRIEPWLEGDRLVVNGQEYGIDGPVQKQWMRQKSSLYLQAPGRHLQSGQKVWLKQCQIAHAHETALTLKRDLEKEGRLLLKLQESDLRNFPRWLGSESAQQSTTLVYERLAGRSLAMILSTTPKPLDYEATKRLLAGRHTLIKMLHTLHNKFKCSHRMLSPETLLLQVNSNRIILQDLGLATRTVQPDEGPQLYQAPEQRRGLPLPDYSTDIYQLGALFFYLLTGKHIADSPEADTSGLTTDLDGILRKAIAPRAEERWPDVYAFSQALRQLGY